MKRALRLEFTLLMRRVRVAIYHARVAAMAGQLMPGINHHMIREQMLRYENDIYDCYLDGTPAGMVAMVIAEAHHRAAYQLSRTPRYF
jgi:hypothetical protein